MSVSACLHVMCGGLCICKHRRGQFCLCVQACCVLWRVEGHRVTVHQRWLEADVI